MLIPIQCEYYALEGLSQLSPRSTSSDHLNPDLEITAASLTMFDARTSLSSEVGDEVRRHLGDRLRHRHPASVRLSEAPSHGRPIALYRPDSRGARPTATSPTSLRARRARAPIDPERATSAARPRRRMTVKPDRTETSAAAWPR